MGFFFKSLYLFQESQNIIYYITSEKEDSFWSDGNSSTAIRMEVNILRQPRTYYSKRNSMKWQHSVMELPSTSPPLFNLQTLNLEFQHRNKMECCHHLPSMDICMLLYLTTRTKMVSVECRTPKSMVSAYCRRSIATKGGGQMLLGLRKSRSADQLVCHRRRWVVKLCEMEKMMMMMSSVNLNFWEISGASPVVSLLWSWPVSWWQRLN